MLGSSRVGKPKVSENEGHSLCAVKKADTVLTAQTRVSGRRESNSDFPTCYSSLVTVPELLHAVF